MTFVFVASVRRRDQCDSTVFCIGNGDYRPIVARAHIVDVPEPQRIGTANRVPELTHQLDGYGWAGGNNPRVRVISEIAAGDVRVTAGKCRTRRDPHSPTQNHSTPDRQHGLLVDLATLATRGIFERADSALQ